jgi:LacI family transcriptional regulator
MALSDQPDKAPRARTATYDDEPGRPARPGMREVARRAGVAMSSVSRVLSGHPDVSPAMRRTVMAAVEDLGYRPDMLAQGLRRGKTFSVGFTVSDIANPVLAEVVTGAEKRLRAGGYSLLLTNSEGDSELDAEHIHLLARRRVDGLLLSLAEEHHPATVRALVEAELPVVLVDRDVPDGVSARSVAFDHASGMRAATEHLLELGHRDVALITGGPRRPARERRHGVEAALGGDGRCRVYEGEFSAEHGARATREILAESPRATAIIAGGNMLMQGALLALREAGVTVGPDISFVGCDDIAVAALHDPPIAVVRRDMRAIGVAAAEVLLADFDGQDAEDVLLPTEFVPRTSCAPPPGR